MLTDAAFLEERNFTNMKKPKRFQNIRTFTIDIRRMWSVKTMVITVIIGGNRYQLTIIRQYLNNILGMYVIKEIQKREAYLALQTYHGK
jgi:hypothetical protein